MSLQRTSPIDSATPDELTLVGRALALASAASGAAAAVIWALAPTVFASASWAGLGIAAAIALALVCALVPWQRVGRTALLVAIVLGIALAAAGVANTGGDRSLYAVFFVFIAGATGFVASRRQTVAVLGLILAAAGLPLLYEGGFVDRLLHWLFLAPVAVAVALVVQGQRERVRASAARSRELDERDGLTGVPNRQGFERRAAAEIERARRASSAFTLLYVDLDGLGRVNERLGHATGDDVLRRVALEALAALRGEDFLARYDDDEFAIVLPGASAEEARQVAQRVVTAVERVVPSDDPLASITASVGSACFPEHGETLDGLVATARASRVERRAERAVERDAALEAAAFPEPDAIKDCAAVLPAELAGGWTPRAGLVAFAAVAVPTLAAWFALHPALPDAGVRWVVTLVALLAAAVACGLTARHVAGRERVGWALLALGVAAWGVPFAGPLAGLAAGGGLLLAVDARWIQDRFRLVDGAGVALSVGAFALALLVPALLDHGGARPLEVAGHATLAALGALAITSALLSTYWTRLRQRPDVWLVAAGFALVVFTALPWLVELRGAVLMPGAWWEAGFPLGAAAVVAGARLRAARPEPQLHGADVEARTMDGVGLGNVLLGALLVVLLLMHGGIPGAFVPVLLAVLLLRHLRSRLLARDHGRLLRLAHANQRELAAQWRANLASLGAALEARDGYTGRHGEETVALARLVGARLGLSRPAQRELETAALLHDIGKIGMPDDILRKPAPLNEAEWRTMREHTIVGERILLAVPGLEPVARAVRHEHERWDGDGYPGGLAGEAIPLASRVVFVCDAFHAMTSDRPYRRAMPVRSAMAELSRCAGTQFDPAVVHALLAVVAPRAAAPEPVRRRRLAARP